MVLATNHQLIQKVQKIHYIVKYLSPEAINVIKKCHIYWVLEAARIVT